MVCRKSSNCGGMKNKNLAESLVSSNGWLLLSLHPFCNVFARLFCCLMFQNVINSFTTTANKDRCNFFGNVEIGKDLSLNDLRNAYTAVVLVRQTFFF